VRRRDNHVGYGKSFDSFLSIVTKNGLGMLILVAMASTFTNEQVLSEPRFKRPTGDTVDKKTPVVAQVPAKAPAKRTLGTPLVKKAPDNAKVVDFECLGSGVFPIDFKSIDRAYWDFWLELAMAANLDVRSVKDPSAWDILQNRLGANIDKRAKQFNAKRLGDEWHTYEFKTRSGEPGFPDEPAMYCLAKSKTQGQSLDEAKKPGSLLRNKLDTIDKNQDVVILWVWSDSFAFFRDLRDWLQSEGYQIGWEPVDRPLYFPPPWQSGGGSLHIDT
jgi:hypothetical protein